MPHGGFETSLLCRSRGLRANRTTRSSWIAPLFRGPTSGRFSRAFARSAGRRSNRSSRTLNDEAASSACGCHHRTMKKRALDRAPVTSKGGPIVGDLPSTLELVLGNQIYIPKQELHPGLRNRLLRLAAFQNPEFYKAQAMRLSTYNKPRVIACAEDLRITSDFRAAASMTFARRYRAWRSHGHSRRTPRRQSLGSEVSR